MEENFVFSRFFRKFVNYKAINILFGMKKGTLEDIVKETGYSKTTISRVLNGKSKEYRISATATNKILDIAQRIDYRPNIAAQMLRNKTSNAIGLILPSINNLLFSNLASKIITEANSYNYTVVLIDTQEDPVFESKALDTLINRNIDGIILVPSERVPERIETVAQTIPLILVDRYFENSSLPYISTNNYEGGYQAVKMLIDSGHTNILCLGIPEISIAFKERIRGCMAAVNDSGKNIQLSVSGNESSIQSGYVETQLALAKTDRPTAIFTLSNSILLGAFEALKEKKMSIPEDMSIISFDSNIYLDYLNPPITRVAQPVERMGIAALHLVLESIKEKKDLDSHLLMSPSVIVRDSIRILS